MDAGNSADLMLDTLKRYTDPIVKSNGNSWTAGQSFHAWADKDYPVLDAGQLIPGEDISVTVTTYYVGSDKLYLPRSVTVSGNSLFACVEEKDGKATAMIACGRHLQNLGTYAAETGITAAEQIEKIDFRTSGTFDAGDSFTAIDNAALKFYNGNNLPIRNLSIASGDNAGLFAKIEGSASELAELSNILLIDPAATATGNVGALVGTASNGKIEHCRVYLEEDPKPASPMMEATIAGGLVGVAQNTVRITDSFAATVVGGTDAVGGLVGAVDGGSLEIERSYAACYLCEGTQVGGLVGGCTGAVSVTVKNSYAAGMIENAAARAAGLVADGSGFTIENSYAAVRYVGSVTGAVYGAAQDVGVGNKVYYLSQSGVSYEGNSGEAQNFEQLSALRTSGDLGSDWYAPAAQNPTYAVFPYRQTTDTELLSTPYPYPMLKGADDMPMLHYGDWLEVVEYGSLEACFYWEKEGSGYKVYVVGLSDDGTEVTVTTLCAAQHTIEAAMGANATDNTAWGYGTIGLTGTLDGTGVTDITATADDVIAALKAALIGRSVEDTAVKVYSGATASVSATVTSEVDPTKTYYCNLGFAAAIEVGTNTMGTQGNPYQIRNVRQLDNISNGTDANHPHDGHYKQTHDLYGGGTPAIQAQAFSAARTLPPAERMTVRTTVSWNSV